MAYSTIVNIASFHPDDIGSSEWTVANNRER